ncbi:MAG TPA: hypothetical protein VH063_05290 [Gaiellaceae bacterium]|nr:hypothetical protein [Gaiellaceae bacterium]
MLLSLAAGALWAGVSAAAGGPMPVAHVPVSIPAGGVTISGVLTLLPAKGAHGLLPTGRAVVIAEKDANSKVWRKPRALRATVSGSVAIAPDAGHTSWKFLKNAQAWVITFTASKPQHVSQAPTARSAVKHMTVVIDAHDGRFIRGFFTA